MVYMPADDHPSKY